MYIVLGVLYESFIHPITILSTLPSAGIGALLALMLFGEDLTIIALIGIILLIGIVKKNAILMIDFAIDAERNEGKTPREAIYQACLLRFRPILMTTVAAMFGAVPLMFGTGTGSELRHPLGVSIVGGLAVSQVLTLFTTPVIYLYFDRLGSPFRAIVAADRRTGRVNLSAPFIARPVATTLLTLGVALSGAMAFNLLPVAPLPKIDAPAIFVSAQIPGASPEVMASSCRHAARAAPGRHRRCRRHDLHQQRRQQQHPADLRARPRHRRRRARRAGGHRRRARRSALAH